MLLATILLLCPFPQIEGTAKAVTYADLRGCDRYCKRFRKCGQRFFPLSAVAFSAGT